MSTEKYADELYEFGMKLEKQINAIRNDAARDTTGTVVIQPWMEFWFSVLMSDWRKLKAEIESEREVK